MPAKQNSPKVKRLTPATARAMLRAIDTPATAERAGNIDGSEATALDGGPTDPWRISVEINEQEAAPGQVDPPVTFSHFTLELLRPDPLILARLKVGHGLHKSDWWTFTFEGDPPVVRHTRAIVILTASAFARDDGERVLRRWIGLHYLARTSPVLVQSARGDAPEDKGAPTRRLDRIDRKAAANALARDLKIKNGLFVRETLDAFLPFLARLNSLPDESLSRQVVDGFLGLTSHDENDARYAAMPDLTDAERGEKERLTALMIRGELDVEGQARLLPLLKRNTAHIKARLNDPARFRNAHR